jgi:hypothetical protein
MKKASRPGTRKPPTAAPAEQRRGADTRPMFPPEDAPLKPVRPVVDLEPPVDRPLVQ